MPSRHFQLAIVVVFALAALLLSCESSDAEKHSLAVGTAVHVYRTETPPVEYPGSDFIAVIGAKDRVKVLDVVHGRGYIAVKIKLDNGREGWVFSGEGIELR